MGTLHSDYLRIFWRHWNALPGILASVLEVLMVRIVLIVGTKVMRRYVHVQRHTSLEGKVALSNSKHILKKSNNMKTICTHTAEYPSKTYSELDRNMFPVSNVLSHADLLPKTGSVDWRLVHAAQVISEVDRAHVFPVVVWVEHPVSDCEDLALLVNFAFSRSDRSLS